MRGSLMVSRCCCNLGHATVPGVEFYSNTVSAICTPEGFDAARIVSHADGTYGWPLALGWAT